jgi:hypothetical protein
MDLVAEGDSKTAMPSLPSPRRLLVFAVLIPAVVATSNQWFFHLAGYQSARRWWLYPWMAFTAGVLSWCAGRYLHPAWFRWLVFGWCLALLNLLTIAACLSGPVPADFAFVLIASQISLLVIWSILADVGWQWRLPGLAAFGAAVVVLAGNFLTWRTRSWGILIVLSAVIVALVCFGLRLRGFMLRKQGTGDVGPGRSTSAHQFGTKHMLIWAAAIGPVLIVARGMEFLIFRELDVAITFHSALLSLVIATLNLLAIWSVLGAGPWPLRVTALLLLPFLLSIVVERYAIFLRPGIGQTWTPFSRMLQNMQGGWSSWFWLNAALLAALLLFVHENGYRLLRANPANKLDS